MIVIAVLWDIPPSCGCLDDNYGGLERNFLFCGCCVVGASSAIGSLHGSRYSWAAALVIVSAIVPE